MYVRHTVNGLVAVALMAVLAACSNGVVTGNPVPRASVEFVDTSRPDASTGALALKVTEPLGRESFVSTWNWWTRCSPSGSSP